jgi:hypothetical protein
MPMAYPAVRRIERRSPAAQELEQAAADQHLALLGREVVRQGQLVARVLDHGGDRVAARLQLLPQPRELPALADLGAAVVVLVGERERGDPLGDEVAAVDAGEASRTPP